MKMETELKRALEDSAASAEPSPGFVEAVIRQLPQRRSQREHGISQVVVGGVLTLGLVALAATAGFKLFNHQGSGSAAGLAQFNSSGIAIDYPESWHVNQANLALHYEKILAYLGTGDGSIVCGADYLPGLGGTCTQTLTVPANTLVVKVSEMDGPPSLNGPVTSVLKAGVGATSVTVAGSSAAVRTVQDTASGADLTLEWTIALPGNPQGAYILTAYLKGPNIAAERADVEAMIGSISFTGQ